MGYHVGDQTILAHDQGDIASISSFRYEGSGPSSPMLSDGYLHTPYNQRSTPT